ncbi:putative protein [uncultured Candidatus Thioglobus sp.]|nr:putative protein [uncultured Candidatus Thioglobus sp.]
MLFNIFLFILTVASAAFLLRPALRKNEHWQAMLTPLSSIIGSGFLIMAPLLTSIVGHFSPLAVLGIVLLAYAIGDVIRFNILHVEPRSKTDSLSLATKQIEFWGNIMLAIAYTIAVAFYLSLLSAFLLNYFGINDLTSERWLTSLILVFIMLVGYIKGLDGLVKVESLSMTVQLAIVVSLLLALGLFAVNFLNSDTVLEFTYPQREFSTKMQMLAGALLIVQGFETSRFIGEKYSPEIRVKSMKNAQIISGVLYVVSVILLLPIIGEIDLINIQLADIVSATGSAATILPIMLIIAALMSQFSAAVADTAGAGGLISENSGRRLSTKISYIGILIGAFVLVWNVHLIEIITLASKAFAAYYFLQTLLAFFYCFKDCPVKSPITNIKKGLYLLIALVLLYVIFFAIPAE